MFILSKRNPMRFLSLLAIASIAFCVSMCTPNPSNNATPVTGNCFDGIQNGTEQGVDCGSGCTKNCNGNMTITANGTTYSNGVVTLSATDGQYYTSFSPNVITQYSSLAFTCSFYRNGATVPEKSIYGLTFYYPRGGNPIGTYTLTLPSGSPTNSLLNKFHGLILLPADSNN